MKAQLRLTRSLCEQVRSDLSRPHPFAFERVGFLFARYVAGTQGVPLVLFTGYSALADDRYIHDPLAGARIDSHAIRGAMQQVIDRQEGVFHVHAHGRQGKPRFSLMDRKELPRLIPSFQVVGPSFAHGLFLLSDDCCAAEVWLPGCKNPTTAARITIVGQPIQITGDYNEQ